jgi:hypothetical protein
MLESKALRIGNFIKFDTRLDPFGDAIYQVGRVYQLSKMQVAVYVGANWEGGGRDAWPTADMRPQVFPEGILLTVEWLGKLGFDALLDGAEVVAQYRLGSIDVYINRHLDDIYIVYKGNRLRSVAFVHEVQNLIVDLAETK